MNAAITPTAVKSRPSAGAAGLRSQIALIGIYEISKIIASPLSLELSLARISEFLSSFLAMRHGLIAILDPAGEADVCVGPHWTEANAKAYFARLPERAIGQIVATATPLVVHDVADSPLFAGSAFLETIGDDLPTSFIGVPIKEHDAVIGAICIDRVWDGSADFRFDEDVRFLTMVANLVGQRVRLHRMVAADRDRLMAEQARLEKRLSDLSPTSARPPRVAGIVGESAAIKAVIEKIGIVARTHSTVLLRGESGTGKELFARAIHDLSPRKAKPFVKLNCAALPESVLESELFGHERGSFTGAVAMRKGRFEMADGGTLFLDEIGEISPSFQSKLLRVLQEGEFERVGGSKTIKVDVRLVCATNKALEEAVARGEFRADLYYRISVVPILLPALRERPGDIALLARTFLKRFDEENQASHVLSDGALETLRLCSFPGNVRELENCIRRTATLARGREIGARDFACRNDGCLSSMLWNGKVPTGAAVGGLGLVRPAAPAPFAPPPMVARAPEPAPVAPLPAAPVYVVPEPTGGGCGSASDPGHACSCGAAAADASGHRACPPPGGCLAAGPQVSERERLVQAMETAGWVQAKAARILGITPRQIGYALKKHGIEVKHF